MNLSTEDWRINKAIWESGAWVMSDIYPFNLGLQCGFISPPYTPLSTSIKINNGPKRFSFRQFRDRWAEPKRIKMLVFHAKFNDDERLTLCVSERFMSLAPIALKHLRRVEREDFCWTHAELCNDRLSVLSWVFKSSASNAFESLHCFKCRAYCSDPLGAERREHEMMRAVRQLIELMLTIA